MPAFLEPSQLGVPKRSGETRGPLRAALLLTILLILVLPLLLFSLPVRAEELRVAVASNFAGAMKAVVERFERRVGQPVRLLFGSTGKHYAQIHNGAPFDAFFAADTERPRRLEEEGVALPGSRFTYAVGKLVLWSPRKDFVDEEGRVLQKGAFRHLALANPRLAPYGKAAEQLLRRRGLWETLKRQIVRGENIAQTFHFVKSGNAELGFVAYSQIRAPGVPVQGSFWMPPQSLYRPIEQQAVLLRDRPVAREFVAFLGSEEARAIIRKFGYDTP